MVNFFAVKNFSSNSLAGKVHSITKQSDKAEVHWIDEEDDAADDIDYDSIRRLNGRDELMEEEDEEEDFTEHQGKDGEI